jgi:hypothetical protein
MIRVLARIIFKHIKKHVATTMTCHLGEIFLVKCQKQAFSFNKKEEKVYYCYALLHVLKRDACIKHEKTKKNKKNFKLPIFELHFLIIKTGLCISSDFVTWWRARPTKMPWLEP